MSNRTDYKLDLAPSGDGSLVMTTPATSVNDITNCPICAELSGSPDSRFAELMKIASPQPDLPTSRLYKALPSLGALAASHTLLVTHRHDLSVAVGLGVENKRKDFNAFLKRVVFLLSERFGKQFLVFEHGSTKSSSTLCSTVHAHVHVLAVQGFLRERVLERLRQIGAVRIAWDELPSKASEAGDFIWASAYGLQDNYHPVFLPASGLPTQLMRRIIAAELGRCEWDWRRDVATEHVFATLQQLQSGSQGEALDVTYAPSGTESYFRTGGASHDRPYKSAERSSIP